MLRMRQACLQILLCAAQREFCCFQWLRLGLFYEIARSCITIQTFVCMAIALTVWALWRVSVPMLVSIAVV